MEKTDIDLTDLCDVCHKKAMYSCPNCGARYCSNECFKKHSVSCVNKFASNSLKTMAAPRVSTEVILTTQKLLANMDANKSEIMPSQEIEPWKAWWEEKFIVNPPQSIYPPPDNVSPLLPYHLVDILYSYCYIMRLYNGDISFDILGAVESMLSISNVLEGKPNLNSIKESLAPCIENTRTSELFVEFQWQVEVVHDVELILQTKDHVLKAVYEMFMIFSNSKHKRATQKLKFFVAWVPSINKKELEKISDEVHEYYTSLRVYLLDVHSKDISFG